MSDSVSRESVFIIAATTIMDGHGPTCASVQAFIDDLKALPAAPPSPLDVAARALAEAHSIECRLWDRLGPGHMGGERAADEASKRSEAALAAYRSAREDAGE